MTASTANTSLHQALVALGSSLVQYVGEAWPWTDADGETDREAINLFVKRQLLQMTRLADLLTHRRVTFDSGRFPTDFTDVHYLSLASLYGKLAESQAEVVGRLEEAEAACDDDVEAAELIAEVLAEERLTLEEVTALAG